MKKKMINTLGIIFVVASFAFIVHRFSAMHINLGDLLNPTILALLVTMPFLNTIIVLMGSFCWRRSLTLFTDRDIYLGNAFAAYARANLAKYLPGNVGHYAVRQMFGAQMGLRQMHLALASLFEIGYNMLSLLGLSLLFSSSMVISLLRERFGVNFFIWLFAVIIAVGILAIVLGFFFRKNKYFIEIATLAMTPRFWLTMIGSLALSSASMLINGVVFLIIVGHYVTLDFQSAFLLISGSTVSYFIGFITPGAPGGIGVREAAMLILLTPFFPSETILITAVVQRLIMIIGDVIVFPISLLFKNEANKT